MVMKMAIKKQDLLQLLDDIDPTELETVYWAVKGIIDHNDQSWYWSEHWQQEEREADQQKANGQQIGPMSAEDMLKMLDQIIENNEQTN